MSILFSHWSFDPIAIVVAAIVALHARGQTARIRDASARGSGTSALVSQTALFYAGLLVLLVAVMSPLDYWADDYLFIHMIQHIILAFFAPQLIVLGAPWLALLRGLPISARRRCGRGVRGVRRNARLMRAWSAVSGPVPAIVAFNAAMIFWHLPGPFDYAAKHPLVHIWLEHGSFFGFGVAFWLQMLESRPFKPALAPMGRAAALLGTNVVMVIIAMTLAMFTGPVYAVYAHVQGAAFSQANDQQLGAAVLWVCGDLTIAPTLLYNLRIWMTAEDRAEEARAAALVRRAQGARA